MNPYKILGVPQGASKDECKKAYRKLSRLYHPDNATGDREKFELVKKAWEMIDNDSDFIESFTIKRTGLRHKTLFTFA